MTLKDELLALNDKHNKLMQEHGRALFEQISKKCKEAASRGEFFITLSESIHPVTKQLLINEGLKVDEQNYRNEITIEIGWM